MSTAVRYYSRSGNTKAVADAIATATGVSALSVEKAEAALTEPIDVLFIGGALYAYGLDSHLKEFIKTLNSDMVGKAVVFSTSWISKHSIDLMRNALQEKGIPVAEKTFYVRNKPTAEQLKEAASFAKSFI